MKNWFGLLLALWLPSIATALPEGVTVDQFGALQFFGDSATIQCLDSSWAQTLQNQNGNMVERRELPGSGMQFIGKLKTKTADIRFEENLSWKHNGLDVKFFLQPEKKFYANSLSLTISLLAAQYNDAVIIWDDKPLRLPKKDEKNVPLPQCVNAKRIVLGNARGVYAVTGDFIASIVNLGYAYQLRIFFTPRQGNITKAALSLHVELGESTISPGEKMLLKKLENKIFLADDKWRVIKTDNIQIKAGSALDLSDLTPNADIPAGKYGRLMVRPNGNAVFEKRPDLPVRFLGFNLNYCWLKSAGAMAGNSEDEIMANLEKYAEQVKRQGYNIVRLHSLDAGLMTGSTAGDFMVPPQNWKRFDHLVKCCRERGIYLYVDLAIVGYYNGGWTPSARQGLIRKLYFDFDGARAHWRQGVMMLMNHRLPDSGLALKDDPLVVGVLLFNEQDLATMPWQGYRGISNQMWRQGFHQWLKKKYGSIEAVKSAWNDPGLKELTKFEDIEFNGTGKVPHGRMRNDMSLYYRDLQHNLMLFYKSVMDECGYKGLITQYDSTKNLRGTSLRNDVDFVSMHDYGAHPSNSVRPGSTIGVGSTIAGSMWYWRSINQTRLLNKPMMVTEYAQGFWNPYSHEAGIAFPAYSALQDFCAIMVHADGVGLALKQPMDEFVHYRSPIFRANEFLAAHLFRRGDVKPARGTVEVKISEEEAYQNGNAEDALNSDQAMLSLVTGFGVTYYPVGAKDTRKWGDIVIAPRRGGACLVNTAFTSTAIDGKNDDGAANQELLNQLKDRDIVNRDNLTDFTKQIFQSDTKELYMDGKKSLMTVITERTEAATLMPENSVKLKNLKIHSSSVPALVAMVTIDGRPIAESSHLVLLYSTNAVNSGMVLSNDLTTLYKQGNLPLLMESGKLEIELDNSSELELWALALDGTRTEKIPVKCEKRSVMISINTARLKDGPTPFFELIRKQDLPSS